MSIVRRVPWPPLEWVAGGVVVLAGWVAGYFVWRAPEFGEEYGRYFDVYVPGAVVALGAPAALAAALLRSSSMAGTRAAGSVVLLVDIVGLTYLVSFAFFGGFCLDENDVCITTWTSRIAALAIALAVLAAGGVLERLIRRTRTVTV